MDFYTLRIPGSHLQQLVAMLQEAPFKVAAPIIDNIRPQVEQQDQPPPPPMPGEGPQPGTAEAPAAGPGRARRRG